MLNSNMFRLNFKNGIFTVNLYSKSILLKYFNLFWFITLPNFKIYLMILGLNCFCYHIFAFESNSLNPDYVNQLRRQLENLTQGKSRPCIEIIEKMQTAGELSRSLLLPEWQGQYLDGENLEIFNAVLGRFITFSELGLRSPSVLIRRQMALLIAETGSVNSASSFIGGAERSVARDPAFRQSFLKLEPALLDLAKNDPESRNDAIYCLGNIDSSPEKLGSLAINFLKDKSPILYSEKKTQLITAKSLEARANSIATLTRQRRAISNEETNRIRSNFLLVANKLIPPAVAGLGNKSNLVSGACSRCIDELTEAMVDSDIVVQIRDLEPSIQEGTDFFKGRIASVRRDQEALLPLAKTLRTYAGTILGLGLEARQDIKERKETLLLLEDFAVIRLKMYDQEKKLIQAESLAGIKSPQSRLMDLEVFPVSEEGTNLILRALLTGLNDKNKEIRLASSKAIESIVTLPDVLKELRESDQNKLLEGIINALVLENDIYVLTNLLRVLGQVAPGKNEKIVPALIKTFGHQDIDVRIQAMNSLTFFGVKGSCAIPALSNVISQGDPEFRIVAMKALESIGSDGQLILDKVAENLRHNNTEVRAYAAKTLGAFGSLASQQLPELEKAGNDPSQEVRLRAQEAILRINIVK